ncbi:MAG: hypothetical protein GX066_01700 [Clostridiaceae bacterium]|nr:hypothetical protein [Clostridiaceae bacterium]
MKKIDKEILKRNEYEFVSDWKIAQMIETGHQGTTSEPYANRASFTGAKKATDTDGFTGMR